MGNEALPAEIWIRLGFFAGALCVMATWELVAPRRRQILGRARRWPANLGIVVVDSLVLRLLFPLSAVAFALLAERRGWGLLNTCPLHRWLAVLISIILLDLVVYLQHVLVHAVPVLWRFHRMHHADLEFDVTTGSRFHPVEIALSMIIKLAVVALLGAPPVAVLIFEVLLNSTAMFNHSNVRLPVGLDPALRWIVVTPDMHRVHHSVVSGETNSNFGFNLPWWDRLFGTYRDQPAAGHEAMVIGVSYIRDPIEQGLGRMLTQPFRIGLDNHQFQRQDERSRTGRKA